MSHVTSHGLVMLLARTHGKTLSHGIDKDSWYRHGLMVLTTPMLFTQTHGIESVLLNHTSTRGPSVTRMRDFSVEYKTLICLAEWLQFVPRLDLGLSLWKNICFLKKIVING